MTRGLESMIGFTILGSFWVKTEVLLFNGSQSFARTRLSQDVHKVDTTALLMIPNDFGRLKSKSLW